MEYKIPVKLQPMKLSDIANIARTVEKNGKSEATKNTSLISQTSPKVKHVDERENEAKQSDAPKVFYKTQVTEERKVVFVHPNNPVVKVKVSDSEASEVSTATTQIPNLPKSETPVGPAELQKHVKVISTNTQTISDAQGKTTKLVFSIKRDNKEANTEKEVPKATLLPGTNMEYRTPGAHYLNKNGQVKRPMNAFMVWAREYRGYLAATMPNATNSEISVKLGQEWAKLKPDEKQYYYKIAERIKRKHRSDFPDWVYKPAGKKAEGNLDQLITLCNNNFQSGPKVQPVPLSAATTSGANLSIRTTEPALVSQSAPSPLKSPLIAASPASVIPVHSLPAQDVKPVVTSTPVRGLYPRPFPTQPVTPVSKTINIQIGSNGIVQTGNAPAVSETTKSLLSNKLGRPVVNPTPGAAAKPALDPPSTGAGTQPCGTAVILTQGATSEAPNKQMIQLPINLGKSVDLARPVARIGANNVQLQTSSLSRLLTEPLGQKSQPNLYRRPDLARQKKYVPAVVLQNQPMVATGNIQAVPIAPGHGAGLSAVQASILEGKLPVSFQNAETVGHLQRIHNEPVEDFLRLTEAQSSPPIVNESTRSTCGMGKSLEEIAAPVTQSSDADNDANSRDELWPFPFPQDPSDSWSESDGGQPMYEELLDSFSSSFDDSDYLYSEVFPGCLKLDVDSWRRYLEDEEDIGSLVDPEACFKPDLSDDISLSPVPLAKTLWEPLNNVGSFDDEYDPAVTPLQSELSKVYADQSSDSGAVNDAEVLESISYFSELTSKVKDVMQQGKKAALAEVRKKRQPSGSVETNMLDLDLKIKGTYEAEQPVTSDRHSSSCTTEASDSNGRANVSYFSKDFSERQSLFCYNTDDTGRVQSDGVSKSLVSEAQSLSLTSMHDQILVSKNETMKNVESMPKIRTIPSPLSNSNIHIRLGCAVNFSENITKHTNDAKGSLEDSEACIEIKSRLQDMSRKDLEKGDRANQCTVNFENEIIASRTALGGGRVRQTCSLSNFEKSHNKGVGIPEETRVLSPCKRQRSATCLIENETSRRKL